MKKLLIVLAILAFATGAWAGKEVATPATDMAGPNRANTLFYFDDMDSGAPGWWSADLSAQPSQWHIDTYYAFDTNSWWCGQINAAWASGDGYGNSWDQRLNIPTIDLSGAGYPILTFKYRYDSEVAYDYSYVQAKSGGVYVDLNPGYDGSSGGWQDIGLYGFPLVYDNPADIRFRFLADGAWSDEDGLYDSDAGALHVDDVTIFDFYAPGTPLFFDDAETGGLCIPTVPGASGDFWHIVDRLCPAFSDPNSWWCGEDSDTTVVPPNLADALYSPVIDVSSALTCTLRFALNSQVPTVDNDYYNYRVSMDGGATFTSIGSWWGDFGICAGWSNNGLNGEDLTALLAAPRQLVFRLTHYTTDNGISGTAGGGAGIFLDDTWVEGEVEEVPVEDSSWGRVKAMYR
jgi:hypothetical protein